MSLCTSNESYSSDKSRACFNPNEYYLHDSDKKKSLILLANCVLITNATILRKRQLLPANLFDSFPVYKDVLGYIVSEKTAEGKKLKSKFAAVDQGIRDCSIMKLAILVEKDLNLGPVEAFVWTFSYSDSDLAYATLGYNGNKSLFSVDYRDMDATQQQFCQMFADLETIFENLDPVPRGYIPSMKIAYRDGPNEAFDRIFTRVDEFVEMDWLEIGHTVFPNQQRFHLQYATIFNHNQGREFENDYEMEFEVARQNRTMEIMEVDEENESGRKSRRSVRKSPEKSPVFVDDGSIDCNPPISRVDEANVLQSELVEHPEEPKRSEKREKVAFKEPEEKTPRRSMDVDARRSQNLNKSQEKEKKLEKKKAARRLNFELPEEEETPEPIAPKKKVARRLSDKVEVEKDPLASPEVENSDISKFGASEELTAQKTSRKYGRSVEISDSSDSEKNDEKSKKFGRSFEILDSQEKRFGRSEEIADRQESMETPRFARSEGIRKSSRRFARSEGLVGLSQDAQSS